ERLGPLQHPTWMTGCGWGSGEITGPVAVDRAGQVTVQIVVARVGFEREAAIHDAHLTVAELRGCLLGGPKEVRARKGAHVSDFSRSRVTAMRRTSMKARRSATLMMTLALTVAAIVVG